MKKACNQLILLGFVCQGLVWEGYLFVFLFLLLWVCCLKIPKKPIIFPQSVEGLSILVGCGLGIGIGRLLNDSTHFFIGNGLMFLLALRLLGGDELKRRDRIVNIVVACILVGVGCTIILDYRFILILIATIILIPRSLMELESESFEGSICQVTTLNRTHPDWTAYLGIIGCMILFFLVFPRGLLGGAIRPGFFGRGNQTSLMESVLDPSQGGSLNSKRIILQIEGENPGYLRTFALTGFDGNRWDRGERNALMGIRMTSEDQLDGYLYRRVRVKDIGPLGKVLPTDGYLVRLHTTDFASRPMRTLHDLIWCARMRNTANKSYEYWIDPNPKPKKLLPQLRERYTTIPPSRKDCKHG